MCHLSRMLHFHAYILMRELCSNGNSLPTEQQVTPGAQLLGSGRLWGSWFVLGQDVKKKGTGWWIPPSFPSEMLLVSLLLSSCWTEKLNFWTLTFLRKLSFWSCVRYRGTRGGRFRPWPPWAGWETSASPRTLGPERSLGCYLTLICPSKSRIQNSCRPSECTDGHT